MAAINFRALNGVFTRTEDERRIQGRDIHRFSLIPRMEAARVAAAIQSFLEDNSDLVLVSKPRMREDLGIKAIQCPHLTINGDAVCLSDRPKGPSDISPYVKDVFFSEALIEEPIKCSRGHVFEREHIIVWVEQKGNYCPYGEHHAVGSLTPDRFEAHTVRSIIESYQKQADINQTMQVGIRRAAVLSESQNARIAALRDVLIENDELDDEVENVILIPNSPSSSTPTSVEEDVIHTPNSPDSPSVTVEMVSLEELVSNLFRESELPEERRPDLSGLTEDQRDYLRDWLDRLDEIIVQSETQLACHIVSYLQKIQDDEAFKNIFFEILSEATATCGDRIALSLLDIHIQYRLRNIDKSNPKNFADSLKMIWTLEILQEIAKAKVGEIQEDDPDFEEEVEVYLAYPVYLQEDLTLDIPIQDLSFFTSSRLEDEDFQEAYQTVLEIQSNEDAWVRFLCNQMDWRGVLKLARPIQYQEIENQYNSAKEEKYLRAEEDFIEALSVVTKEILFAQSSSSRQDDSTQQRSGERETNTRPSKRRRT